jgi:predicted dinucleotide-binding enzyme
MPSTPIKVAVIGTGNIGGTLGRAFARAGHEVSFGTRRPAESSAVSGDTSAAVTDVASALASADVVLLAVPAGAVDAFVAENGNALREKLVIDATNRIGGAAPANAHAALSTVTSHYARAFNTLGWENFEDPHFGDVVADLFYSAPEGDTQTMEALISAVGLRPQYLGDGQQDVVDGLLRVWFALVMGQKRPRRLALRVLD